jgi:recombination protein RecT
MSTDLQARMEAASPAAQGERKTLATYVNENVEQFERAIGDAKGAELLARTLLTEMRRTPKLADCTVESFMGAAMTSAQTNLMPGAPLGHSWLVPMKNKQRGGVLECEWWLGYQGMMELGYRSGLVLAFEWDDIRAKDKFWAQKGTDGGIRHEIDYLCEDRGPTYAYWAQAKLAGGGAPWVVLTTAEVDSFRARSPGANASSSPWKTDYRAMALKTCIRQLYKLLPTTPGIGPALHADQLVSHWDPNRPDVPPQVIDVDATDLYNEADAEEGARGLDADG